MPEKKRNVETTSLSGFTNASKRKKRKENQERKAEGKLERKKEK